MLATPALLGFGTGLSLIVAIGAQNAFILRQGITRQHVWVAIIICMLSDIALISAGIAGLGALIERAEWIMSAARIGGALFLALYALFALRRALSPTSMATKNSPSESSAWRVALTTLALTWLNPHVYVDTVLLLGSIGNSFAGARWQFGAGAIVASLVWFMALGVGSRYLARIFAKPRAWQLLDGFICLFMLYFAIRLILPLF